MSSLIELFSLNKKIALVVGGAGKIGLPMAEGLAEAGATVYIGSRNLERCENAAARIGKITNSKTVFGICLDQSNEKSVKSALETITNKSGVPSILINSGVERPMTKFFDDTLENWDRSMQTNARGLFLTCRSFGTAMTKNGGGSIINVASIYGLVAPDMSIYKGTQIQTEPDYPYTKGGMIMFSKYLASMWASAKVRVNVIAPGGLFNNQGEPFLSQYTAKVPMGRMAYPDDLKGVAVFLASNASSYMTGTTLSVDGGWTSV